MKAVLFTCLLFIWIIPGLFSQEEDSNTLRNYRDFLETFHEELADEGEPAETSGNAFIITNPEPVPEFLTFLPVADRENIYAIGISDPFMSRSEGRELAYLRAKSLTAIMKVSVVKHISDYFVNERTGSQFDDISGKYIDFYMITSALTSNCNDFQVLFDTVNRYGESIILLKYTAEAGISNDTLISIAECMSSETRDNSKYEVTHRIELKCENKTSTSALTENYRFVSFKKQKSYEVNSVFNGKPVDPPLYRLRYKNTLAAIPEGSHESIPSGGLWNSFIEGFFKHLFIEAKMQAGKIKTTGDQHTSTTKILNREVSTRSKLYVRLEKINILDNRMYVNVQFINE